jgi:hypothetical protein
MKFFLQAGIAVSTIALAAAGDDKLAQDDAMFWGRLLQSDGGSIPLPPSPTAPTPTGTPPVAPPSSGSSGDCLVSVAFTCVTRDDGTPCDQLTRPNPQCADGTEINSLTFGYSGNSCNPAANKQGAATFCEDSSPILFLDEVTVLCRDGEATDTALVVEPPVVEPGATFSVTSPSGGALPNKVDCIFTDMDDTILQQVVIDASGDVQIDLMDEFGAFTLLSCELPSSPPGGQSCLEILTYTVDISNIGSVDMDVTVIDFIFGGATNDLLGELDTTTVSPGDSTTVSPIVLIDLCMGGEFCAEINVEAEPPNGAMCQDSETYCFDISQLPPSPVPPPSPEAPTTLPPPTPGTPTTIPPPVVPTTPETTPPGTPSTPSPTPYSSPSLPTVPTPTSKSKDGSSKGPDSKGPDSKGPDSKGPDSKGPSGPGVISPPSSPSMPTEPSMPSSKGPDSKGPDSKGPDSKGPEFKGPSSPGFINVPTSPSKGPDSKGGDKSPSSPSSKSKDGFINPGVISPGSPTSKSSGSMSGDSSSKSGGSMSSSGSESKSGSSMSSSGSSSKSGSSMSSSGSDSKSGSSMSSSGSDSKSGSSMSSSGSSSKSGSSMSSSGSDSKSGSSMSSTGSSSKSGSSGSSMSSTGSSSKSKSGSMS